MKNFLSFLSSKKFYVHLFLAFLSIGLSLYLTLAWLKSYTQHAEYIEVPDFSGQELKSLESFIVDKSVGFEVVDSIYDPKRKKGIVIEQDPDAGTKVKHNRRVYLYVTRMVAPQMLMPKLIDRSERQARLLIETYGLKVGAINEVAADCNGCVLAQSSGGKEIEPGSPVKKGSVINLTIGRKNNFFNSSGEDSLQALSPELQKTP